MLGTQIVATLIAVYGLFMTPLGWGWALFVWGYALLWFLMNDRVKRIAYRVFDPTAGPLLAKQPVDLTPQITRRAHELYEHQGHREDYAVQDWLQAEREIRKDKSPTDMKDQTMKRLGPRAGSTHTPSIPVMLPLPTCLAASDSEKPILKRWFDNIVRRVIVGREKPPPSPAEQAVDEQPPQPPFLYKNHRFTEAFTALRGHQLTGELSFSHATNVLLEDMPPEWTEPEKRAFLRLSLQDASRYTPAFDMSDVVYTPSPDTPQVPDFQHVFLVNADFHHAVLPNADFTGAYLKRASFRYTQLPYASFKDAVLMQTDMDGAVLDGANFLHADLRRVYNLDRASLEQALYNEQTVFPNGFNPYFRGMLDVVSRSA